MKKIVNFRCNLCNKLLFRSFLFSGEIEIKCPRCSTLNYYSEKQEHQKNASK